MQILCLPILPHPRDSSQAVPGARLLRKPLPAFLASTDGRKTWPRTRLFTRPGALQYLILPQSLGYRGPSTCSHPMEPAWTRPGRLLYCAPFTAPPSRGTSPDLAQQRGPGGVVGLPVLAHHVPQHPPATPTLQPHLHPPGLKHVTYATSAFSYARLPSSPQLPSVAGAGAPGGHDAGGKQKAAEDDGHSGPVDHQEGPHPSLLVSGVVGGSLIAH
jgi:hypothetical protein